MRSWESSIFSGWVIEGGLDLIDREAIRQERCIPFPHETRMTGFTGASWTEKFSYLETE